MKTSIITTTYNEEKSIYNFLKSLNSQSILPDELVIVDSFSNDRTLEIINNFIKSSENKLNIKVIQKTTNRSKGRNLAISNTKNDVILCSDAGTIIHKDWVKNISEPFNSKNVDAVSGYYLPEGNTVFQRCLATYTCVMPDKLNDNFLPSSRSVAFRKRIWNEVNGYPEEIETCEDLVFDKKILNHGYRFYLQRNAIVYWNQKENLIKAFKQFFVYARGDGQALYFRINTPFIFLRYIIGLLLVIYFIYSKELHVFVLISIFLFLYFLWTIKKNYKYVNNIKAIYILPLLQISSDIATIFGFSSGLIDRLLKRI